MPNGIDWEKISGEKIHPIETMLPALQVFVKQNNFKLIYSTYHDGLEVEISNEYKSENRKFIIHKEIRLDLIDKGLYKTLHNIDLTDECEKDIYCRLSIVVYAYYGIKDLIYALIPVLKRIKRKWYRGYWSKVIGSLVFPVDLKKLTNLLNQSKQILDNFDESWLNERK